MATPIASSSPAPASTSEEPSSSSSSEVSLTIKSIGAECCQLRVALDLSVRDLKQAVAAQMDVPVERQRLIYGGQVLKDDLPLRHYKLEDGVVVHLVARPEGATANVANDEPPAAEAPRRRPPTGFGPPGVLMGTVTLPEGQGLDLTTIMNSMLGGIGQTLAVGPQAQRVRLHMHPPLHLRARSLHRSVHSAPFLSSATPSAPPAGTGRDGRR